MDGNQRYSWDEEKAVAVGQPNPAPALPLQHDQLLPQRRDLSLEPRLRSERRDQDGPNEPEEPDQLTRFALPLNGMRFSVHTALPLTPLRANPCFNVL